MQILINGLIQGLLYGMVGLGFAVVYNSTGIFYIAQGAIFSLTPFIVWLCIQNGFGWQVGVVSAIAVTIIVTAAMEALNHWPLQKREASKEIHLISSLGIFIVRKRGTATIISSKLKWSLSQ
mgnify:CR=1 FL=1